MKVPGIYVDTSALMRALMEDDAALLTLLRDSPVRVTSALTFTEAPRALWRARTARRITAAQQQELLATLREFETHCHVLELAPAVLERARERFPTEFVGTLDALHLASVLLFTQRVGPLTVVSTNERLRSNARGLGLRVLPTENRHL